MRRRIDSEWVVKITQIDRSELYFATTLRMASCERGARKVSGSSSNKMLFGAAVRRALNTRCEANSPWPIVGVPYVTPCDVTSKNGTVGRSTASDDSS